MKTYVFIPAINNPNYFFISQIIDLFQTYITYYVLNKTTLEGIEEYATNFNKLFKTISSKTYDALDHRLVLE